MYFVRSLKLTSLRILSYPRVSCTYIDLSLLLTFNSFIVMMNNGKASKMCTCCKHFTQTTDVAIHCEFVSDAFLLLATHIRVFRFPRNTLVNLLLWSSFYSSVTFYNYLVLPCSKTFLKNKFLIDLIFLYTEICINTRRSILKLSRSKHTVCLNILTLQHWFRKKNIKCLIKMILTELIRKAGKSTCTIWNSLFIRT